MAGDILKSKMKKVMGEYKNGKLKSGKIGPGKGPKVKNRNQAVAIGLSEARKAGAKLKKPKGVKGGY